MWYNLVVLFILLAALSAVVWGTGDYCGGRATRRGGVLGVTVLSQLAGLPVLAVGVVLLGGTPTARVLVWGAVAGCAGFLGILVLYRGLAQGSMMIFAPTSAVTAAVLPMGIGLMLGDRPGAWPLAGACCAVVAIGLVSASGPNGRSGEAAGHGWRSLGLALLSGALFGVFFILLGRAGADAGMWPLVGVRVASVGIGLLAVGRTGASLRLPPQATRWALAAGSFDVIANVLYLVAAGHGMLSLVAPVGSLYPVSTALLAYLVDGERIRPVQVAGLGLAATALVLVAT